MQKYNAGIAGAAGTARADADEVTDDAWVVLDEAGGGELMLDHRVVRNSLRGEREYDQLVVVFRRQKALGDRVEEVDRRQQQCAGKIHGRAAMAHDPRQAALV